MTAPRLVFVTKYHYSRFSGGSELQCWMLAKELARRGWDVHYVSEMNQVPNPLLVDRVTLHGLPEDPPLPEGNRLPLRELMRQLHPAVVIGKVYNFYVRDAILEAPKDALTIWWMAAQSDGKLLQMLWMSKQAASWLSFMARLPRLLSLRYAAAQGRRRAALILEQYKGQAIGIPGAAARAAVLHNSHAPVPESEVQNHAGKPRILWLASIKKWKRPELFWELARRCGDLDATFVITGGVREPHYEAQLKNALETLPNLEWIDEVPHAKVGEVFRDAHLFICTSISEGFSNTFIESWMHGVPVVSLGVDPGGYLNEKGLGVRVKTMDELESAVRDLVRDVNRRREIGARARSIACEDFLLENNADRFEQLLAERGVKR